MLLSGVQSGLLNKRSNMEPEFDNTDS